MRNHKIILAILIMALMSACKSSNKSNPYEGLDYEEVCEDFDKLAYEQKDLLDKIRAKYKNDRNWIVRFNDEQISWIQYQDKRLRSLYSKDWDTFYRKNYSVPVFNGCKCKELIRLSEMRNAELRVYLDGPHPYQEECPIQGSL